MISAGKGDVGTTLRDAVIDSGTVCPVEDLQSKGIDKVRVISQSQLNDTIRLAVNRVLRSQLSDLPMEDSLRQQILERAADEFAVLIRDGVEKPLSAQPEPPPSREALTGALAHEDRVLAELSGIELPAETDPSISPEALNSMEKRMAESISSLLSHDLRREMDRVEDSHREHVGLLELRIAKLANALESTDRALSHLQFARVEPSEGASSPQGLDPSSPLFVKKSQLLDALFQANVELRHLQDEEE